jgi:hypothetical protein
MSGVAAIAGFRTKSRTIAQERVAPDALRFSACILGHDEVFACALFSATAACGNRKQKQVARLGMSNACEPSRFVYRIRFRSRDVCSA